MSRHLSAVPDEGPLRDAFAAAELIRRAPYEPTALTVPLVFARSHPTLWGPVIDGEVAADLPGWWVCPDCGRRRDRAGEPRTVTSVLCTGPAIPYSRRHAPTEMRIER